ncbi:MAG: ABC transporter ATP-binding protein [Lentisphaeria bacterium]|nr:ABC transporter ATP-binding protein [Candidatus Neomarinimicrobiota bacterium]MCF7841442.1 ABC transporter ATP-binding protein [Lentisphaeria bacterium]
MREKLFEIKGLKTYFNIGGQTAKAVDGVDFDIYKGEILGVVGESGSGKSVSLLSLIQLIPNPPGEVTDGEITFNGENIFNGDELKRIKAVPQYRFFNKLDVSKRTGIAFLFMLAWFILHLMLPIPGFIPFLISMILMTGMTWYLFFNSPRKRHERTFREKMYTRMRQIRGSEIAMIFQEPMTSLNPVYTIGMQIVEAIKPKSFGEMVKDRIIDLAASFRNTRWVNKVRTSAIVAVLFMFFGQLGAGWSFQITQLISQAIWGAALPLVLGYLMVGLDKLISEDYHEEYVDLQRQGIKLLDQVGIPSPETRLKDYPHQFSGGMRQRVMIAMALAKKPSLLIADEPTTALDVTIQAQILELMKDIKDQREDAAIVLITHDLAVIAETCERVIVMYGGKIQEVAEVKELFDNPLHPYTKGLLGSIPRPELQKKARLEAIRGMVPNILNLPEGCKFCTRCDVKIDKCDTVDPDLVEVTPGHSVRCHLVIDEMVAEQKSPVSVDDQ